MMKQVLSKTPLPRIILINDLLIDPAHKNGQKKQKMLPSAALS
jgi:hypothetical protein